MGVLENESIPEGRLARGAAITFVLAYFPKACRGAAEQV